MIDDPIPVTDHVSRHCRQSRLTEDGRPMPAAFHLRTEKNENYLSVDWLEFLDSNRTNQLEAVRKIFKKRGYDVKAKDVFAVLNVDNTINYVKKNSPDKRMLSIVHQPRHQKDSHSGIFNTNHSNMERIIAIKISESVEDIYPAKQSIL